MRLLGLDIGGTSVKAGIVESDGTWSAATETLPTTLGDGAGPFLDALAGYARSFGPVDAIGLGCPGVFDPATGALRASANLEALVGTRLGPEISRRLERSEQDLRVGNDANLAAYGEQWKGAGVGKEDLCLLTLGTGIGGGLILGGKLFGGPHGMACEIGHLVVLPREQGGLPCGCGSAGCLETFASATHAKRRAREAGLTDDLELLCERARECAGPERTLLETIGRDLGRGLSYVVSLLDVTDFIVGGGFSGALDLLEPGMRQTMEARRYGTPEPSIVRAALGEDAGWIGAARLAGDPE